MIELSFKIYMIELSFDNQPVSFPMVPADGTAF